MAFRNRTFVLVMSAILLSSSPTFAWQCRAQKLEATGLLRVIKIDYPSYRINFNAKGEMLSEENDEVRVFQLSKRQLALESYNRIKVIDLHGDVEYVYGATPNAIGIIYQDGRKRVMRINEYEGGDIQCHSFRPEEWKGEELSNVKDVKDVIYPRGDRSQ